MRTLYNTFFFTLLTAFIVSFIGIMFFSTPVHAQDAGIEYELLVNLPGVDSTVGTSSESRGGYFAGIFILLIGVTGVLSVIMLVVAGIQYVGGAANPQVRSDAKERIIGALIGLLLALGSWMILNSINQNLTAGTFDTIESKAVYNLIVPAATAGNAGGDFCVVFLNKTTKTHELNCYNTLSEAQEAQAVIQNNPADYELVEGVHESDGVLDIEHCAVVDDDWWGNADYHTVCEDNLPECNTMLSGAREALSSCFSEELGDPKLSFQVEKLVKVELTDDADITAECGTMYLLPFMTCYDYVPTDDPFLENPSALPTFQTWLDLTPEECTDLLIAASSTETMKPVAGPSGNFCHVTYP